MLMIISSQLHEFFQFDSTKPHSSKSYLSSLLLDNVAVFVPGTLSFLFKVSFMINEGVTATILQLLTTALCDNDSQKDSENKNPGSVHQQLVQQLTQSVDIEAVRQFVRCFLLQSNSTSIRWQAHSLLHSIHRFVYRVGQKKVRLFDLL